MFAALRELPGPPSLILINSSDVVARLSLTSFWGGMRVGRYARRDARGGLTCESSRGLARFLRRRDCVMRELESTLSP
jgi:hypothetical protein